MISVATLDEGFSSSSNVGIAPKTPQLAQANNRKTDKTPPINSSQNHRKSLLPVVLFFFFGFFTFFIFIPYYLICNPISVMPFKTASPLSSLTFRIACSISILYILCFFSFYWL